MLVERTRSTASEGKSREELPIPAVGDEGHGGEAVAEVGLPEGDGNEIPADCPLEEELKAPRILGLEGNDVLALFVPLLELGGPRKSKSSDSMGRLGYLVACGQVAARDDVERVSGYLGGCHCLFPCLAVSR